MEQRSKNISWFRLLTAMAMAVLVGACAAPDLPNPQSSRALPMVHPRMAVVSTDSATIQQPRRHEGKPVVFQLGMRIPQRPEGVVLVVPGNLGLGKWQEKGGKAGLAPPYHKAFANRILTPLAIHGIAAAVMTPPTDSRGPTGLNQPLGFGATFRQGPTHADDIAAAADYLRMRFRKPVWLLGWSEATVSVVNAVTRRPEAGDGLILAAPWTAPLRAGLGRWLYANGVLSLPIERIQHPVLIMSHNRDGCAQSASDGPGRLASRLVRARAVFSAGYARAPTPSTGCGPESAHGFARLESRMAAAMAGFIQRHSRPLGDTTKSRSGKK